MNKKAVIYGAGSIGRGFIGELMHKSGYDIYLIDVNKQLLGLLNDRGKYDLKLISPKQVVTIEIPVKKAVDGTDEQAVVDAIRECDIIFTAVGAGALKYIAPNMAKGLMARTKPVNIILCENMQDAHKEMNELLLEHMTSTQNIGMLRASVGRMVPLPVNGDDPLIVKAEPYYHLPIDADCIVGDMPEFIGLERITPFDFAIEKKLFIHNLGHAASAWLGNMHSCEYIWQSLDIEEVKETVRSAMLQAANGLVARYNCSLDELIVHIDDLILRFTNRSLGDTVSRVGRDTRRKLSSKDRAIGALNMCMEYNLPCDAIIKAIRAGLKFENDDEGTLFVKDIIDNKGIGYVVENICGIDDTSVVYNKIIA